MTIFLASHSYLPQSATTRQWPQPGQELIAPPGAYLFRHPSSNNTLCSDPAARIDVGGRLVRLIEAGTPASHAKWEIT